VTVTRQAFDEVPLEVEMAGEVRCGERREFLRLWPASSPDVFAGVWRGASPGECTIEVRGGVDSGRAPVTIRDDFTPLVEDDAAFTRAVTVYGGEVFDESRLDALVSRVRQQQLTRAVPAEFHPMRSGWWLLPFVACLAIEWWLRRRSGLP
jgi:hypothetical protein